MVTYVHIGCIDVIVVIIWMASDWFQYYTTIIIYMEKTVYYFCIIGCMWDSCTCCDVPEPVEVPILIRFANAHLLSFLSRYQ